MRQLIRSELTSGLGIMHKLLCRFDNASKYLGNSASTQQGSQTVASLHGNIVSFSPLLQNGTT